ncbi:MAG: hypothetical protein ACI9Y1_001652 [Lentisphaeria bacterium]|jgi:hypothetical protein
MEIKITTAKINLAIVWLFLLFPFAAMADNRILHEANYQGEFKGFTIKMTRTLYELGGGRFLLKANATSILGYIEESEEFLWSEAAGIVPQNYRYKQSVFSIKHYRSIDYDWSNMVAHTKDKKDTKKLPLQEGILGPMSYQLKLQLDLVKGEQQLNYHFVNRNKVKNFEFSRSDEKYSGQEKVWTDNAILVKRTNEGDDRQTKLWFDVGGHFTLASLLQEDGGDSHAMVMESYTFYPPFDKTPFALIE